MPQLRIHDAGMDVAIPPRQLRIHDAAMTLIEDTASAQLRIHFAEFVIGEVPPPPGWTVTLDGQRVEIDLMIRIDGEWVGLNP